ncbi:MAG: alpha-hydroxy acid oxidase [Pseudomonadota bacterium]
MRLSDCRNTADFRELARRRLPAPLFHYIDGGSDDESTLARNTAAFDDVDIVPRVLTGVDAVDMSVDVLGCRLKMPIFFSPTALQRLFHPDGEWAPATVAEEFGSLYGLSTIGTRSIEEMGRYNGAHKLFQIYVHKDAGFTNALIDRCREAQFDAIALTVDTIVAGNRERDYRTGMTTPPKLTLSSLASFITHPYWTIPYLRSPPFDLPNVTDVVNTQRDVNGSVGQYIDEQMETCIRWDDAAMMIDRWQGPFVIKGVSSVDDARRAVEIGASAIMLSNHGGRQLDGARAPFDQVAEIADAVGGQIEIIVDGGIRRGTHVLKAIANGATACSGGRFYLYALAAGGAPGVRRAMRLMHEEIERDMRLTGITHLGELDRTYLRRRHPNDRAAAT